MGEAVERGLRFGRYSRQDSNGSGGLGRIQLGRAVKTGFSSEGRFGKESIAESVLEKIRLGGVAV